MQLNLVNVPGIVAEALSSVACEELNPKFGTVVGLNEELFKYVLSGPPKEVFIIERISLNELFDGIPQSIEDLKLQEPVNSAVGLTTLFDQDLVREEPIEGNEQELSDDPLDIQFQTWKAFIGFGGLQRGDVDLSSTEGYLHVDARRSAVFSGTVSIKVKVDK